MCLSVAKIGCEILKRLRVISRVQKSGDCRGVQTGIIDLNKTNLWNHDGFANYVGSIRAWIRFAIARWVENDNGWCQWISDYGR